MAGPELHPALVKGLGFSSLLLLGLTLCSSLAEESPHSVLELDKQKAFFFFFLTGKSHLALFVILH